jgi:glycosyltransferase involved in cell wall biosynthesis
MNAEFLAVVVIGRNEGERLVRCLESIDAGVGLVVYVDSGSSDGSVAFAREFGATTHELEPDRPFTAARARNAGLKLASEKLPGVRWVQFIDGDCELQPGWLESALLSLASARDVVAVCGRRRERFPRESPYNRLCDLEWDTPIGETQACGGDVMMCIAALLEVGGYADELIAGEDPELSHRLRKCGGRILRLDQEMTLHDADMHQFRQWWQRTRRSGHAYAQCWERHRTDRLHVAALRSIGFWSIAWPLVTLVGFVMFGALALVLLLAYGVLFLRVRRGRLERGDDPGSARLYAAAVVVGKWAHAHGALEYGFNRLRRAPATLIEYKAE